MQKRAAVIARRSLAPLSRKNGESFINRRDRRGQGGERERETAQKRYYDATFQRKTGVGDWRVRRTLLLLLLIWTDWGTGSIACAAPSSQHPSIHPCHMFQL